jgi:hypothetical protein
MFDAILFAVVTFSAGIAALRGLGLAKGAVAVGRAPGAGLAVLAVVSTWLALLNAPPPSAGCAAVVIGALGLVVIARERSAVIQAIQTVQRQQRLALPLLVAALLVPCLVMGIAFAGVEVPLSPHDGAAHTEAIQAYRLARAQLDWYPPGLTGLFAAWLQLSPWLDTAAGAFALGLSLPLLAAIAVFGLSVAIWGDLRIAAASALLLGFTYVYPYFPELWSGWPLAATIILTVTLWGVAYEYLARPSLRLAVLAGLLLAGIILTHGTEVYTLAIVLPVVLVAFRGRARCATLPRDVAVAVVVGLACSAIYLPTLLHWAGSAGAYAVGLEDAQVPRSTSVTSASAGPTPFIVFGLGALGIDLPLRAGMLLVGIIWTLRTRRGRSVFAVGALFTALAVVFTFLSTRVDVVRQVYALTFPWGMHYRLFMVVAICQALLAGAGGVVLLRWLMQRLVSLRVLRRLVTLLALTWLGLMTWAMTEFMAYPTSLVLGYTADDAAAMAWLRAHASARALLVNDGYADAGIWAPYKAGVPVLLPRWGPASGDPSRLLVWREILKLDQDPAAAAAACALHATYVYRGAHASEWDTRTFPSEDEMRAAPDLQEVFTSGEASVFALTLPCP